MAMGVGDDNQCYQVAGVLGGTRSRNSSTFGRHELTKHAIVFTRIQRTFCASFQAIPEDKMAFLDSRKASLSLPCDR